MSLTHAVPSVAPQREDCPSNLDQTRLDISEVRADSNMNAGSMMLERIERVPDGVVKVARADGTWMFKVEFQEANVPSSLLTRSHLDEHPTLRNSKSIRIVWNEQWMDDVPGDLEGDRYWNLARTLDTIIGPSEDVVWLAESALYAVGENQRRNHICLEQACLTSKGTQCPRLAIGSISQQLAERVSADEEGQAGKFNDAVEHLGKVVQDTYNSYPNDPSRMTAAMLALASSDNPFRRLMRV